MRYIYNTNIIKHNKLKRDGQLTPKFGGQLTLAVSRLFTTMMG